MKALKIITIILVVILTVFLVPPLFMASETKVEKTMILKASPEVIWEQVNCLENWEAWDVWHQDTNMTGFYEGPECGVGAKNIWKYHNSNDGGTQTIVESVEFEYIRTELDFGPMGKAETEFKFEKLDEGTKVTWNFSSPAAYPLVRWISVAMIKPEVGKSYEQGLQKLYEITMNMKPKPNYKTGDPEISTVNGQMAIAIKSESGNADINNIMGSNYGKLHEFADNYGAEIEGAPFAIWYQWEDTAKFIFDCALPVKAKVNAEGEVRFINTYKGKVATVQHQGDYSHSGYSWEVLMKFVAENGLIANGDPYEVYIIRPDNEPNPELWMTSLYFPVK